MWRSLFLAVGAFTVILGVEFMAIDKAVLKSQYEVHAGSVRPLNAQPGRSREFVPKDWAPWSLMSGGAVVMLYSFTIPRRARKD